MLPVGRSTRPPPPICRAAQPARRRIRRTEQGRIGPDRETDARRGGQREHGIHLPDQLDADHRFEQHGDADQRRPRMQRVLAGRKLRHTRYGSTFVGNILALTSITVNNSVTVHGRALARNGAVTLNNDTFTPPTCATSSPVTTTTAGTATTAPTTATTNATSTLPRTGSSTTGPLAAIALGLGVGGLAITGLAKRRRPTN